MPWLPWQGVLPSEVPWCPQVRLLTGIGRYNDMSYIFELLHHKQHFEVLMRKKLDPVGEGMVAAAPQGGAGWDFLSAGLESQLSQE